ncbi:hypothetical protein GCM10007161_05310 [Ignatzschineria indica]|uniref:Uncharacterized protein n=1 Tax=Ignatzschineria indica TaxID=472583 RepID=A0A2U2AMS1_9GAMM|nr:hypothetical protein [Ignatzschineria indica]PWD84520.1 hypothetical protein DC082_02990 [Ignatzschineria indica]GGZ77101.1 hypothetical protein GCM10007161_05310 [Ignatzschineria indica]
MSKDTKTAETQDLATLEAENKALQADQKKLETALETETKAHEATKKALEVAEKKLQELESGKTKDGLNIVYLQTPIGIKARFRAGIKVTNERVRHEVSDEVLAELQQDNAILISQ